MVFILNFVLLWQHNGTPFDLTTWLSQACPSWVGCTTQVKFAHQSAEAESVSKLEICLYSFRLKISQLGLKPHPLHCIYLVWILT